MAVNDHLRDLRKINRAGVRQAQSHAAAIRNRAIKAFLRTENTIEVRSILQDGYKDFLTTSMLAAYYRGYLRIEREALGSTVIKFSENADLERALSKLATLESVEDLQQQLESRAIQVLDGATNKVETKLRGVLSELHRDGASAATGRRELGKAFNELGLTPANSYTIENIFRTQTQLVYGAAKDHAEQAPAIQEILFGHKYVTVGDVRVRDEHAAMEGVVFVKGDPLLDVWYPPNGWSCRCAVIPLFSRPPGRLKKPPGSPPEVDPDFAFRPGSIIQAPAQSKSIIPDRQLIAPTQTAEQVIANIDLPPSGIKVDPSGQIKVRKARNIKEARAQLEYLTRLREAALGNAERAKSLPKNSKEAVTAALQLRHVVAQYQRVVNHIKRLIN